VMPATHDQPSELKMAYIGGGSREWARLSSPLGFRSSEGYNGAVSNTTFTSATTRTIVRRSRTASVILLVVLTLLGPAAGARPASAGPPAPDPRFGIVEAFVNPAAATEAGAGYTRIILRWDVIQPAGAVDWKPANVPDPLIAEELAAGREVVAVLIGTPAWASTQGGRSAKDVPDLFYWQAFVRRMAQQYQGRIRHWIIWNEPDVWDINHPGATWAGSEADYYQLLKAACQAIKDVDPAMQVHVAGLTYYWDWEHGRRRYLDRLLDVVAADPEAAAHDYFFDGVIYHLYFNPNQTADVLAETRQALAKRGITGKEIWINETNAPPSDDKAEPPWSKPRFRITLGEQAAFVIQEVALAFSSGASRVEFYKLRNTADHPESIEPFGLLRADNSPRPAFTAYRVAATTLRDFRSAYRQRAGDVTAVTFDRGDLTTTVLWTAARKPTRVRVRAIAREATLVDEQGGTRTVKPVNGAYLIDLPAAACSGQPCGIGGAPRLLVEAGAQAGRRALAAPVRPASVPKPAPTPPTSSRP
jgi:hypothetical protein